jgi:hypothetical protein
MPHSPGWAMAAHPGAKKEALRVLTSGNFVRLGENPGEAPDLSFDVGVSFNTGIYSISMDLLFENLENYHVYFRNGVGSGLPPASQVIANVIFDQNGDVVMQSLGGNFSSSYGLGETIRFNATFDMDNDTWSAFLNGAQVVNNAAILSGYLGSVTIGFEYTRVGSGYDGVMQFDNVMMAAVPEPSTVALVGLGLLGFLVSARRPRRK